MGFKFIDDAIAGEILEELSVGMVDALQDAVRAADFRVPDPTMGPGDVHAAYYVLFEHWLRGLLLMVEW